MYTELSPGVRLVETAAGVHRVVTRRTFGENSRRCTQSCHQAYVWWKQRPVYRELSPGIRLVETAAGVHRAVTRHTLVETAAGVHRDVTRHTLVKTAAGVHRAVTRRTFGGNSRRCTQSCHQAYVWGKHRQQPLPRLSLSRQ